MTRVPPMKVSVLARPARFFARGARVLGAPLVLLVHGKDRDERRFLILLFFFPSCARFARARVLSRVCFPQRKSWSLAEEESVVATKIAHAYDCMMNDLQSAIQVLLLHAEESSTREELIEVAVDEVRQEMATTFADMAEELQTLQELVYTLLNSLVPLGHPSFVSQLLKAAEKDSPLCGAIVASHSLIAAQQDRLSQRAPWYYEPADAESGHVPKLRRYPPSEYGALAASQPVLCCAVELPQEFDRSAITGSPAGSAADAPGADVPAAAHDDATPSDASDDDAYSPIGSPSSAADFPEDFVSL